MNQKKLLNLVEALRKAGQVTRNTLLRFNYGASPWDHNAQVDAAAKALAAELELEAARVEELLRGINRALITMSGGKA